MLLPLLLNLWAEYVAPVFARGRVAPSASKAFGVVPSDELGFSCSPSDARKYGCAARDELAS